MKRYALFCCEQYYPSGGWKDLQDSFDDVEEAASKGGEWEPGVGFGAWHVVDLTTGKIVREGKYVR